MYWRPVLRRIWIATKVENGRKYKQSSRHIQKNSGPSRKWSKQGVNLMSYISMKNQMKSSLSTARQRVQYEGEVCAMIEQLSIQEKKISQKILLSIWLMIWVSSSWQKKNIENFRKSVPLIPRLQVGWKPLIRSGNTVELYFVIIAIIISSHITMAQIPTMPFGDFGVYLEHNIQKNTSITLWFFVYYHVVLPFCIDFSTFWIWISAWVSSICLIWVSTVHLWISTVILSTLLRRGSILSIRRYCRIVRAHNNYSKKV